MLQNISKYRQQYQWQYQGTSVLNPAPLSLSVRNRKQWFKTQTNLFYNVYIDLFNTMSEPFMVCYKNTHSELQLKLSHVSNTSP